MDLDIYYSSKHDFQIQFNDRVIPARATDGHVKIEYESNYTHLFTFKIQCFDPKVINDYITVTKIVFDNYWTLVGPRLNIGTNVYSSKYIEYASAHNIPVNDIDNNSTLFFMGELVFKYTHPIQEFFNNNLRAHHEI